MLKKYERKVFFLYIACKPENPVNSGRIFTKMGYTQIEPGKVHDIIGYISGKSDELQLCDDPNAGVYIIPLPQLFTEFDQPQISAEDALKDMFKAMGAVRCNKRKIVEPKFASSEWWFVGESDGSIFDAYRYLFRSVTEFADVPVLPFQTTAKRGGQQRSGWLYLYWPWLCMIPWWYSWLGFASNCDPHVSEDDSEAKRRQ